MNNIKSTLKHQELYDYVKNNIGTENIRFRTKVSKEEFKEYLDNYPGKVVSNAFMGYKDYYDFESIKDGEPLWNYMVARIYFDFGAEDYLLPTI